MAAVICILILQGASAINIHFSASSGGQTVGVVDSYSIDDSVGVSGKASASFGGGVSIEESNSLWGSGSAIMNQAFYGSGGGADYVIYRALSTLEASKIAASASSTLTPAAGKVSTTLSTTGSLETASELWGVQGGDIAGVGSGAILADISTSQSVATGGSVAASQKMSAEGMEAWAYARAVDADWNYASTYAEMVDGTLATVQGAEAGNSATAGQTTEIEAYYGWASSYAWDADGNYAGTYAGMVDGTLATVQGAEAGNSATAGQTTGIEAGYGYAGSGAWDADWNYAGTYAYMEDGTLATVQGAEAGNSATSGQTTGIEAEYGWAGSYAWDADGNWARTYAEMEDGDGKGSLLTDQVAEAGNSVMTGQFTVIQGERGYAWSDAWDSQGNSVWTEVGVEDGDGEGYLITYQMVEAGDSAYADQISLVAGDDGWAYSWASDDDGNYAETYVNMDDGAFITFQAAEADDGARAAQLTLADAWWAEAGSYAEDDEGSYVDIYAEVLDGTLVTLQVVEAVNSAEGFQDTVIEGEFAWAFCEAYNPDEDYYAYVDNYVEDDAYLEFYGEAAVDGDEAWAHQISYAEGLLIWPWANSTTQGDEKSETGTFSSESFAWTNSTGEGAIITEL